MNVENEVKQLQEEVRKLKERVAALELKTPSCPPPKEDPPNMIHVGRV